VRRGLGWLESEGKRELPREGERRGRQAPWESLTKRKRSVNSQNKRKYKKSRAGSVAGWDGTSEERKWASEKKALRIRESEKKRHRRAEGERAARLKKG